MPSAADYDIRVKLVRFTIALDADVRLRHRHQTVRSGVVSFVVQLEVRLKGRWRPVIRYDSAHGQAHRHVYRAQEKSTREALNLDLADALTFAEGDMKQNWRRYIEEYDQ
jgi:O-succinylbenzoate synthase